MLIVVDAPKVPPVPRDILLVPIKSAPVYFAVSDTLTP